MTNEEIIAFQEESRRFRETSLGEAFYKFRVACERANRLDAEDNFTDKDRKSTKDAWEKYKLLEEEFITLLKEFAYAPTSR